MTHRQGSFASPSMEYYMEVRSLSTSYDPEKRNSFSYASSLKKQILYSIIFPLQIPPHHPVNPHQSVPYPATTMRPQAGPQAASHSIRRKSTVVGDYYSADSLALCAQQPQHSHNPHLSTPERPLLAGSSHVPHQSPERSSSASLSTQHIYVEVGDNPVGELPLGHTHFQPIQIPILVESSNSSQSSGYYSAGLHKDHQSSSGDQSPMDNQPHFQQQQQQYSQQHQQHHTSRHPQREHQQQMQHMIPKSHSSLHYPLHYQQQQQQMQQHEMEGGHGQRRRVLDIQDSQII